MNVNCVALGVAIGHACHTTSSLIDNACMHGNAMLNAIFIYNMNICIEIY